APAWGAGSAEGRPAGAASGKSTRRELSGNPCRARNQPEACRLRWADTYASRRGTSRMAFLMTYHQHAAQKHPVEGWLKELIEHPSNVLGHMDARHWSERQAVLLCMQT